MKLMLSGFSSSCEEIIAGSQLLKKLYFSPKFIKASEYSVRMEEDTLFEPESLSTRG